MSEGLYAVRVSNERHDECKVELGSSPKYATAVGGGHWTEAPNVWLQIQVPKFGTNRNEKLLQSAELTSYQRAVLMNEHRSERYQIIIRSEAFADLASYMMGADPEAAIKAFGAALQTVPAIPRQREPEPA